MTQVDFRPSKHEQFWGADHICTTFHITSEMLRIQCKQQNANSTPQISVMNTEKEILNLFLFLDMRSKHRSQM